MDSLEEFLEKNKLQFADFLADETRDRLSDIWMDLQKQYDGELSDADVDELIGEFQMLGEVVPQVAGPMIGIGRENDIYPEDSEDMEDDRDGESAEEEDRTVILILEEDAQYPFERDILGDFTNPKRRRAFEFRVEDKVRMVNILAYDIRFEKLLRSFGEQHTYLHLFGEKTARGFEVYEIHTMPTINPDDYKKMPDDFLQFMIGRLKTSVPQEMPKTEGFDMMLSDRQSIEKYIDLAGGTLPPNILAWAKRNLLLMDGDNISQEEKRHAQRALSLMLNVRWMSSNFPSIDPVKAREVLDEELYGLENVKQRIIETVIQINRTHTLPAYGLLLLGPAGTGKSQIAYAVAKILKLPYAVLDMSTVHDPEALTGTPRIYTNARPGLIMQSIAMSGSSNIVFVINELDKADSASQHGSPADTLLTLLDNLGFTDNYMECAIPTQGVYTIATANDKTSISDPLLSRFAVIEITDYSAEEKKEIFKNFSLPRVLKRIGMTAEECQVTDDAVDVILDRFKDVPGCRELEQVAELLAGNALYEIESKKVSGVTFDAARTKELLNR